ARSGSVITTLSLHDALPILDFNLRVPRPWPERQDPEQREAFKEKLQQWAAQEETFELWFQDEPGVEGDQRTLLERPTAGAKVQRDRKSTRLNSSHDQISYTA